ncbi:MAG: twitching motility protein PilT [Acidobacteria bacterium RIFCSPLOWO2_02_FULL_65_29]|nr:MAG: twitching motility protein PilT [Acidobacteria bacterium RIFCSPLOWO2_02_FULL_65_29]
MRLLLDTHLLLWAVASSHRLPVAARQLIEDPHNEAHYSAASLWEIAIKATLRRDDFQVDLSLMRSTLPAMGLQELPVRSEHAVGVTELPPIHRDPFDRLLVAQSIVEPMVLLTNDALLARYGPVVRVV